MGAAGPARPDGKAREFSSKEEETRAPAQGDYSMRCTPAM
jgi:hypothetical protein